MRSKRDNGESEERKVKEREKGEKHFLPPTRKCKRKRGRFSSHLFLVTKNLFIAREIGKRVTERIGRIEEKHSFVLSCVMNRGRMWMGRKKRSKRGKKMESGEEENKKGDC